MKQTRWQKIIAQLKERGWTQTEMAAACNVSQAAINQLKLGLTQEPKHSLGESLISLLKHDHTAPLDAETKEVICEL